MAEFYAEGNNGGDNISIVPMDDDTVKLKVGHCCVYTIDYFVPVEFITAALTLASEHDGGIVGFIRALGWDDEYTESLIKKIRPNPYGKS